MANSLVMILGFESHWVIDSFNKFKPDKLFLFVPEQSEEKYRIKTENALKEVIENIGNNSIIQKKIKRGAEVLFYEGFNLFKDLNKDLENITIDLSAGEKNSLLGLFIASMFFDNCRVVSQELEGKGFSFLPKPRLNRPSEDYLEVLSAIKEVGEASVQQLLEKGVLNTKVVGYNENFNEYMKNSKKILYYFNKLHDQGFIELEKKEGNKWFATITFMGDLMLNPEYFKE